MSKRELMNAIERELRRINCEIDRRIITGTPYQRLARQHRELRRQLAHFRGGWLRRSLGYLTLF